MDAELTQLAAAGASTLVKLMVSDLWSSAKAGVGRLLGEVGGADRHQTELESSRAELLRAQADGDLDLIAELEEGWRLRLRSLLRSDPALAGQLRALLEAIDLPSDTWQAINVRNTISGGTNSGTVIQAGNITGLTTPTGN